MAAVNLSKKQKLALAGGGVVVLAGVLYWRKKAASSSSSSSSTDPNAIDPLTGLPYAQDQQIDPLTGLTYLAEAQQYGTVAAAEAAFSGATSGQGYTAGYGASSAGTAGYPTSNVTGGSSTVGYATNAAWSQAVVAGLVQLGYDAQTVSAALGAFFAQMPLTPDQAAIVQAAEAEYGAPPQGTYSIVSTPSGGGTGTGTGTGSGTGTGTGSGSSSSSSGRLTAPTDLHLTIDGKTGVRLQWNAVSGASGYIAQCKQGGDNGPTVNGPFFISSPVANFGSLKSGTHYTALIWPSDSSDPGGPGSNQPHTEFGFTTPK